MLSCPSYRAFSKSSRSQTILILMVSSNNENEDFTAVRNINWIIDSHRLRVLIIYTSS